MTSEDFLKLSADLQKLSIHIPLHWGKIQNDCFDKQLNIFNIHSFEELNLRTKSLDQDIRNYFQRRWFLWKCAQCDEHIFCLNPNVTPNPEKKDQAYDIEFNGNAALRFDVKSTVIPRQYRGSIETVLKNPQKLVNFFYQAQSKGVRDCIQNRIFILHHSYRNQANEIQLRCKWNYKTDVFREYASKISTTSQFINYNKAKSDIIFIFENLDGSLSRSFVAL